MEENKQKIDEATLADAEKISEKDLDEVAGGNYKENLELDKKIGKSPVLEKYGWNWFNKDFYTFKRIMSDVGIETNTAWSGANNQYRDKETGQFILHQEVMDFLETGVKSWRKQ